MTQSLVASYEHCSRVAQTKARNFYYSFLLLPAERRQAICAIYAFMRHCDDLSDDPAASHDSGALDLWRAEMAAVLRGGDGKNILWPAFRDTVERYRIPHEYFHAMIDGVASDLVERRIETFDELYDYCYRVASVVGLTIVHIFGFDDPAALALAEKCGIAFQLTNILRDVREDAERRRIYLPAEDLMRFGVAERDFLEPVASPAAVGLFRFEAERAKRYYDESRPLVNMVGRESQRSLWALIEIYSQLLQRIEQRNYEVLAKRVRLSAGEKVWILVRAMMRAPCAR